METEHYEVTQNLLRIRFSIINEFLILSLAFPIQQKPPDANNVMLP